MFTLPKLADVFHEHQAQVDPVDFDIILAGYMRNGVFAGCAVTAQGTPDNTVAVASGTVAIDGLGVAVTAGNLTCTADATNPRFYLITVNSSGTKAATAGTPAADPVFPAIPADSVALAAVYVPANDSTIESDKIVDKRVELATMGGLDWAVHQAAATSKTTSSTSFVDVHANLNVTVIVPPSGAIRIDCSGQIGGSGPQVWAVLEGGSEVQNTETYIDANRNRGGSAFFILTGLTPGSTHTYSWGIRSTSGTSVSIFFDDPTQIVATAL